jgi:excisionase family DNA binding protein
VSTDQHDLSTAEAGEYLGVKESAEYLGVNESTIRRWIKKGLLPAERVGPRLLRIKRADLDALKQPIGGVA